MTRRERDSQLFSNYTPWQALAFSNRFDAASGTNYQMKAYSDWIEDLRTGWYQQRKNI
jgi:hypothetical protein